MRGWLQSPVATININSNIFEDDLPKPRDCVTLNLIRRATQRKYNNLGSTKNSIDRYKRIILNEEQGEGYRQSVREVNRLMDVGKGVSLEVNGPVKVENDDKRQFRGNDHQLNRNKYCIYSNVNGQHRFRGTRGKSVANVKQQAEAEGIRVKERDRQHQTIYRQQGKRVNPYTHRQYSYLTHKHKDELCQIKKHQRNKPYSTITHSYKVQHLKLSPHKQRRKTNMGIPITSSKAHTELRTATLHDREQEVATPYHQRLLLDGPSPSPWDWAQSNSVHRDFIE